MSHERQRFVLNSAVLPGPGTYDYRLVSASFAREWLRGGPYISTIAYDATAEAMARVVGERPVVQRERARLRPGDEALVFRLKMRVGGAPLDLQRYDDTRLRELTEIGLLRRTA